MPPSLISLLTSFPVPTSAAAVFGWLGAICILVLFVMFLVGLDTALLRLLRLHREEWTKFRKNEPLAPNERALGLWGTKGHLKAIDGGRSTSADATTTTTLTGTAATGTDPP